MTQNPQIRTSADPLLTRAHILVHLDIFVMHSALRARPQPMVRSLHKTPKKERKN